MRILLLVDKYLPNIQSCVRLMHDLAVVLREEGHEVVLTTADHSLERRTTLTREEGITVLRVRSGRSRGAPLALRAYNEWRLPAVIWRRCHRFFRDNPCDLIACYSPTIFFGPLVRRLKRLWGCRNYLILRDIFPQWSVDAGLLAEGGPAHRLFRHYELLLYDTADVIGVISPKNLEYFQHQNLASKYRLEVLHNWAPVRQEVPVTQFRRALDLDDKVVFFYGGNLGVAQDVGNILRLAERLLDRPEVFFLIAGDGSEADKLKKCAVERRLSNVRFHPPVDQRTYLGMLSEFDVGLTTLNRNLATHNVPYKILDYMACGKPILASLNPGNDLLELLQEHEAGLVCLNGEDDLCYQHSLRLATDAELRQRLGRNGRALLEKVFSPTRAARQILAHA